MCERERQRERQGERVSERERERERKREIPTQAIYHVILYQWPSSHGKNRLHMKSTKTNLSA